MILNRPLIQRNFINQYPNIPYTPLFSPLINIPFTISIVNNDTYQINYDMTINNNILIYGNGVQITSNVRLIQIITTLFNDLLNILCNTVPNDINNVNIQNLLNNIYINNQTYEYQKNINRYPLYDLNEIKGIYHKLHLLELNKLCQAYRSINKLNTNVNITQLGGSCININLFMIKKYYTKCNCKACNKFENMTMGLFNSIQNNDLHGVIENLIPSFMSKHDFHLLFKLSEPFLDKYNLPYFK